MNNIALGIIEGLAKVGEKKLRRRVEVFVSDGKGKILAGKSPEGGFMFPGGGIDKGETINQAADRETKEEVGLSIKNVKGIGVSPEVTLWTKRLQDWMNEKGRTHEGSRTYYRTALVKGEDKSLLGKDGDNFKAKFYSIDEIVKGLKRSLKGAKDKFKPFRETDKKVLSNVNKSVFSE